MHGAESTAVVEAKAAEVRAEIRELVPWLDEPSFLPAVSRWLRATTGAAPTRPHRRGVGQSGAGAVPVRQWEQVTAADRLAAKLGTDLGLDPIGRARIMAIATAAEVGQATLADLAELGRRTGMRARLEGSTEQEPS